jgi:hypothetical protein
MNSQIRYLLHNCLETLNLVKDHIEDEDLDENDLEGMAILVDMVGSTLKMAADSIRLQKSA